MGRYRLNRHQDTYGKIGSGEEKIKENAQATNFEWEAAQAYKGLSAKEKDKTSKADMMEKGRELDHSNQFMKTLSDTKVYKAKINDRALNVYLVDKMLKKMHPNLYIEPNLDVIAGMNGLGHRVRFRTYTNVTGFEPICAVGKAGDMTINPESKFVPKKDGVGEQIESRGWIACIDQVMHWLENNKIRVNDGLDIITRG